VKDFVNGIVTFSLRNRMLIFAMTGLIAIVGIYSYLQTPIVAFPDFTNTEIRIITQWPGKSAEEIERFVTIPIEITMNAVQRKTDMRSRTMFGLSTVSILFEDGVTDEYARQQILALMPNIDLPPGVTPDLTPNTGPIDEIFRYTLHADTNRYSATELRTIQDWIVERTLRTVPGVADVNGFGGKEKTYEVSVNPKLIEQYGLTALDVYNAIQNSNVNVGGDVIERASQNFVVRGIGLLKDINDIEKVIVTNINGVPVLVKNVAEVKESNRPRLGQVGKNHKDDVVEAIVLERKGLDPTPVLNGIREKIQELNDHILPPGIKIDLFYDRQTLIDFCLHTVLHNIIEGMLLVIIIVFLFTLDWKSTLILSLTVPLSILFAFIILFSKGMFANLISIGALDFGILVDGTVVIVEGLFVAFAVKAQQMGMERFNKMSKLGIVRKDVTVMATGIFFAQLIMVTALLPIFTFQKVEGKIFSPLAYMLGFALLGSLIITFTFVPAASSLLFNKNVREKHNPIVDWLMRNYEKLFDWVMRNSRLALTIAIVIAAGTFFSAKFLGTEFLPELDEGALWVRGAGPSSLSLTESKKLADSLREELLSFPEVKQIVSQTGRPDDGTDIKGFSNIELLVDLFPEDQWKSKLSKEELIDKMSFKLNDKYAGVLWTFSQPILDNVNEAVAGIPVNNGLKIYGTNLDTINAYADKVDNVMRKVRGMTDVGRLAIIGQPELNIQLNLDKMSLYGVTTANANAVIQMAIGGQSASQLYEDERHFDIRIRYQQPYRKSENEIGNLMVPTSSGTKIPLKEIASIEFKTGPVMIYRDNNQRYAVIQFSTSGRDLGSTVNDAMGQINKTLEHLPKGYHTELAGEYSSEVRAMSRLGVVVPISISIIFLILLIAFRSLRDSFLILANVPFAMVGGILALHITHTPFNISAGVGFVALFGVCIQNGIILLTMFRRNLDAHMSLHDAIKIGALKMVRPIVMASLIAIVGLLPAALSHGVGAQTSRPFAIVIVGGGLTAMILVLIILPLIFKMAYAKHQYHEHHSAL
jgi:cobalt-zinc-cadmium resistance protein CzcA